MKFDKRIVVCSSCGCLYDLHYINSIKVIKKTIIKFECKNCGLQDVIYSQFFDKK